MTDSERDLLQETLNRVALALESMERLIEASTKKGMLDHHRLRKRLLRICRSPDIPREKKVKLIAYGMKKFSFLCQLDDHRNELKSFCDSLTMLAKGQRVPASEIPYWRGEYYANMAAIYVLDHDEDES